MNSIRTQLVTMLIAAFTLVTFLAALNGYRSSMAEAESLMDTQLADALSLLEVTRPTRDDPIAKSHGSSDFVFQVWRNDELLLRSAAAPDERIGEPLSGFRYINFSGYRWRTLAQQGRGGSWYIVAERADRRHMLAEKIVLESILPLLLWLPVSAVLIWVLVGLGLRPLRELSSQINLKQSDDLEPLQQHNPPAELVPLVQSANSLLARLASSFEREKHFAAHAAHELRTPLSVLKVHLHNLASELPAGHRGLEYANSGVERMHHLVEQILDLNRTNPNIIKANFQALDLHSLAQRVTAEAWPRFSEKGQNLSLSGETVWVIGDAVMLEILLHNLLDNANKYTPENGAVLVSISQHRNLGRLVVEDSGPGVSAVERDRVFERFYRLTESSNDSAKGSGLGLAIVQHIVQLHNADITLADSQLGTGLAVTVELDLSSECIES
jgi:two-component system sensor histidine kinase QseC